MGCKLQERSLIKGAKFRRLSASSCTACSPCLYPPKTSASIYKNFTTKTLFHFHKTSSLLLFFDRRISLQFEPLLLLVIWLSFFILFSYGRKWIADELKYASLCHRKWNADSLSCWFSWNELNLVSSVEC